MPYFSLTYVRGLYLIVIYLTSTITNLLKHYKLYIILGKYIKIINLKHIGVIYIHSYDHWKILGP